MLIDPEHGPTRFLMAWIDLVIIGIIVLSALISLIRGFVKESISLVTWVVAGLLALRYYGPMADLLEPFINSVTLRQWIGGGILFVATLIVGAIVNFIVSQLEIQNHHRFTIWLSILKVYWIITIPVVIMPAMLDKSTMP